MCPLVSGAVSRGHTVSPVNALGARYSIVLSEFVRACPWCVHACPGLVRAYGGVVSGHA